MSSLRQGSQANKPMRRQASGSPENQPASKRANTTTVPDDSSARRDRRRAVIDPFAGESSIQTATPSGLSQEPRAAAPVGRESPPAPTPPPRTGLSKKDADYIVGIKTEMAVLRTSVPKLQSEFDAYKTQTDKKLDEINEEFNDIAREREIEAADMLEMKQQFQELSFGHQGDAEDVKEEQADGDEPIIVADNLLKETVHRTINHLMKRFSARAKPPASHLVDGQPVFWPDIDGSRTLRPWWEGEWADQVGWVPEAVELVLHRGTVYNPEHKADVLLKIPPKVVSDVIQTTWKSLGRSVDMAAKPVEVQQASISKNTQNSRKTTKAEKREKVLGSGHFSPEFVQRNKFLRHAPYASSENTECESDGEDPMTKPPAIDASSPPQAIDKAKAEKPKKGKAHLPLVSHPPDYRSEDVNEDIILIDDQADYTNAKRSRRRGKARATEALPKVNGPKGRTDGKALIPVDRVKDSWFAVGKRRTKYRTKGWVDLSGDNEAGTSNVIGSGTGNTSETRHTRTSIGGDHDEEQEGKDEDKGAEGGNM